MSDYSTATAVLNLDRRVTVEAELSYREFGEEDFVIQRVADMVAHMINWESELESRMTVLLKTIEKYYYKSTYKKPLEYEYHFPRHAQWSECPTTYMKIAHLVFELLKTDADIEVKGKNLSEMNFNIYNQLEDKLAKRYKSKLNMKLQLGENLVPLTIYTCFQTRQDCMAFLKDLQKESSQKHDFEVSKDVKELKITVSSIVRLVCNWEEPSPLICVLRSFFEHNLPLEAQSVISLDADLETIKDMDEQVCIILEKNELFVR
jgi:hypothetical protein